MPLLRALAFARLPLTVKLSLPAVSAAMLRFLAAASAVVPPSFAIVPVFSTVVACSATRPPSALMVPALITLASLPAAICRPRSPLPCVKFFRSSSVTLAVEATSPPTSTLLFLPKSTPFGLMTKTLPVAESEPSMMDRPSPTTRLMAMALLLFWSKWTFSSLAMLNFCQSRARRSVF